jgi:hypothetical protein
MKPDRPRERKLLVVRKRALPRRRESRWPTGHPGDAVLDQFDQSDIEAAGR